MDRTPKLPTWIRRFTDPKKKCTNVYELLPRETKLFGTESLVDWDGVAEPSWNYGFWKTAELFLLAQDASNAELIKQRRDTKHPDPFCAFDWRCSSDGFETNRNLHWLAQQIDCRKLYGSALVGLLKDGSRGGATPKGTRVRQYTMDVLEWVIDPDRTPLLKAIACLGTTARDLVADVLLDRHAATQFKRQEVGASIRSRNLYVIYLRHPGRRWAFRQNGLERGCGPNAWQHWKKIARDCGLKTAPQPWMWLGP